MPNHDLLPDLLLLGFHDEVPEDEKAHIVHLKEIQELYSTIRSIYRATKPKPDDIQGYKVIAMDLGRKLLINFKWANWTNYLHRTIEHVQQILSERGSTGAFSTEGSEANNKQTRMYCLLRSRTSNAANSMDDITIGMACRKQKASNTV